MIQLTGDNLPKCAKCGENALTIFSDLWLCGKCFNDFQNKLIEQNKKAILEE